MQAVIAVLEPGEFEFSGQDAHDPAPAPEYVPAPQFEHAVEPPGEDVPAPHCVHAPPLDPVKPALQVHAVNELHPLHDSPEFSGHA